MSDMPRQRFVEAMLGIWSNAGEEYDEICRPLFRQAVEAFADVQHDADQLEDAVKHRVVCTEKRCIAADRAALLRECGLSDD